MKIQCTRCGNVRYTDQPIPTKDEIGAAICWNCREVTICKVYAKEPEAACEYCEVLDKNGEGSDICHNDDWSDRFHIRRDNDGKYRIECYADHSSPINFCPMCGRRLTKVK